MVLLGYIYGNEDELIGTDLIINGKVYKTYTDVMGFTEFDESDNLILYVTEKKKRVFKLVISPNSVNAEQR